MVKKEELKKALIVEEKVEELRKNNIEVKNGTFTLKEKAKKIVEKELDHKFKKNYFSEKNAFLYNGVKEILESKKYTFYTSEELEEKAKELLEEVKKEEEEKAKAKAKAKEEVKVK